MFGQLKALAPHTWFSKDLAKIFLKFTAASAANRLAKLNMAGTVRGFCGQ